MAGSPVTNILIVLVEVLILVESASCRKFLNGKIRLLEEDIDRLYKLYKACPNSERGGDRNEEKWFFMNERIPESNKTVLVYADNGAMDTDIYGDINRRFLKAADCGVGVIAWRDLPEPPVIEDVNV